ncbi:hypothetical protein N8D56_00540 [Devosia sp. A8/3-2]|nr:hypothetical protein N8D56_00540 [Devosia sp. A8/3-2]
MLDLMVPGTYVLVFYLVAGAILSLIGGPVLLLLWIALGYLLYRLARVTDHLEPRHFPRLCSFNRPAACRHAGDALHAVQPRHSSRLEPETAFGPIDLDLSRRTDERGTWLLRPLGWQSTGANSVLISASAA